MSEPIVSLDTIRQQARDAAVAVDHGKPPANPYPLGTAAAQAWDVAFYAARRDLNGDQ